MRLKHFKLREFDSPDQRDSGVLMNHEFLRMLDAAREHAGIPFRITSGYRTHAHQEYLTQQGYPTSPTSAHLRGYAADISAKTSSQRLIITASLLEAGFERIGIGRSFIHCDIDPDKPSPRLWLY